MVQKDHIDEWLNNHLKWYINTVEQQETESSGLISMVWIGFHLEIFQLHTLVGHKHSTLSILGHSVVNQNIDVEWLQYSLILASKGGIKSLRIENGCFNCILQMVEIPRKVRGIHLYNL